MFSKKKTDSGKDKAKESPDMKVRLDSLEMESVTEQLREIEAKKVKDKKKD